MLRNVQVSFLKDDTFCLSVLAPEDGVERSLVTDFHSGGLGMKVLPLKVAFTALLI